MLLTCPNCSARYLLSSIALGDEGREVRCAKCNHEWYQERDDLIPQEDELEDSYEEELLDPLAEVEIEEDSIDDEEDSEDVIDNNLDEDPIPEGVRPRHDDVKEETQEKGNIPALLEDVLREKVSLQAKLSGYATALVVFSILIAGGVMFKQQIVSSWLPAAAIYNLASMPVSFKGEGLVMESLSANVQKDVDGRNFLLLEGRVVNLTSEVQQVPELVARLRSTNGEDSDSWSIDTPLKKLEPGESFSFKSDYENIPSGAGSVNLTFAPIVTF